uniref:Uncharacterized protein n=1 Tax=Acrobeloides nanus TaxID=290746 RepID=A0A914ESQ2_9BILA
MGCRPSWRTCQCKNGYIRYNNTCILKDDCPEYLKCGPHAFWGYGSSEENQISCDDITSGRKLPKNDFLGPGTCICEGGFVRLTKNGICIRQEKCANRNKNST